MGPLLDLIGGGNVEVSKDTVQPEPEKHFSFSTRLMIFAIDQYQSRASHVYRPFTSFCVKTPSSVCRIQEGKITS